MSETRTYIVPEQPQQNPNDSLAMMAMLNGNGGFGGNGMWNNPFMYLVWMWMMRWMNNGWGENGDCQNAGLSRQIQTLQEQMQDNHNSDLIMQGINGMLMLSVRLLIRQDVTSTCLTKLFVVYVLALIKLVDNLDLLEKELSTLLILEIAKLLKLSIAVAATHRRLSLNKAIKTNQQMKDRLIRLLIVQIQQDVQQKEDSVIVLTQLRLRLALFKILLETQATQTLIRLQLSLMQCRIRLYQIRLMLFVKRIVNRLLLSITPNRLLLLVK